ncbi:hypothetical protein ITP53_11470 [Nonomuraea sp. K274]|uniref:Uncharacterized protein n=1 Tax=Nonomuraea cypriaca TaxID=1187855 RepID=A0A931A724_9ACTN|nr:hypothetical protein [Nonomuraea cypriaca]MBF8186358.1 hypothetical protein [Nonomuraea cypriaca]
MSDPYAYGGMSAMAAAALGGALAVVRRRRVRVDAAAAELLRDLEPLAELRAVPDVDGDDPELVAIERGLLAESAYRESLWGASEGAA